MLRIFTLTLLLAPTLAHASSTAADACAANLPADAKAIYAAIAADFAAGNSRPDVNSKIISLANDGKIDRAALRESAKAAAACLKQWN